MYLGFFCFPDALVLVTCLMSHFPFGTFPYSEVYLERAFKNFHDEITKNRAFVVIHNIKNNVDLVFFRLGPYDFVEQLNLPVVSGLASN